MSGRGRTRHRARWGTEGGPFGDMPFFGGFPGLGGPGGPGGGRHWRAHKARRGDIRMAALLLLAEEPRNGYQIMQEVQERSGGVWRPSPGSVYPALSQLEDEGLIRSDDTAGRRLFDLTDQGRAYVEERSSETPPWEAIGGDSGERVAELGTLVREVASAFVQVVRGGNEEQLAQAREVLVGARRALYRILADEQPESESGGGPGPSDEPARGGA
ncbi:MAG: PadR family transcriptional regulator [Solirubrobacterales bacterium]|nr:PadR family transcriptional regulator [Solirubrobacterales bacterium]